MPENEEPAKKETLEDLTISALAAQDFAKAKECATQMLKEPEKSAEAPYWPDDMILHWGRFALGIITAWEGDEKAAKTQLLAVGENPSKEIIDKIGLNLDLIKKLQDAGEKEQLRAHLEDTVKYLRLWGEKQKRWSDVLDQIIPVMEQASKRRQSEPARETEE